MCRFRQLILRKIIKVVATRSHVLKLQCTKFDFGWGFAPDLDGELSALPRPPSWISGVLLLRGEREGKGKGGKEGGGVRRREQMRERNGGNERRKGRGWEGRRGYATACSSNGRSGRPSLVQLLRGSRADAIASVECSRDPAPGRT